MGRVVDEEIIKDEDVNPTIERMLKQVIESDDGAIIIIYTQQIKPNAEGEMLPCGSVEHMSKNTEKLRPDMFLHTMAEFIPYLMESTVVVLDENGMPRNGKDPLEI